MPVGILKYPVRRQSLPYGNILYLPLREMVAGVSPNLLSNAGMESGDPPTGWSSAASVISAESTIVKSGSKSLKVISSAAWGASYLDFADFAKYKGITSTFAGWVRAASTNNQNRVILDLADSASNSESSVVSADDVFHEASVSHKVASNATYLYLYVYANSSAVADADDTAYLDDASLTVPQMVSRDGKICHPEGCSHVAGGFIFDGIDDLITFESDFIGTNACTIIAWIFPTGWGGNSTGHILANGLITFEVVSDGRLYFTSDDYSTWATSAAAISLNSWKRVAVTRTAANPAITNLYINGVLSGAADQSSGNRAGGYYPVDIGNRLAGDRGFAGTIDDVQVYNRVLSAVEIQADFTANRSAHL